MPDDVEGDPALEESELDESVLQEILAAVELPEDGIRKWLAHDRAFCEAHGGRRVYGELLALFDACDAALDRRARGKPA